MTRGGGERNATLLQVTQTERCIISPSTFPPRNFARERPPQPHPLKRQLQIKTSGAAVVQTRLGMKRRGGGGRAFPAQLSNYVMALFATLARATFHNPQIFSGSQRGQRCRFGLGSHVVCGSGGPQKGRGEVCAARLITGWKVRRCHTRGTTADGSEEVEEEEEEGR